MRQTYFLNLANNVGSEHATFCFNACKHICHSPGGVSVAKLILPQQNAEAREDETGNMPLREVKGKIPGVWPSRPQRFTNPRETLIESLAAPGTGALRFPQRHNPR